MEQPRVELDLCEGDPLQDCYLINLASRPERLAEVYRRLDAVGMRPNRFAALTAQEAWTRGYRSVTPKHEQDEWSLTPGNFGCAATHLEIYASLVSSGRAGALIMEDDVCPVPEFASRVRRAIESRRDETHVVQLGYLFSTPRLASRAKDRLYRLQHGKPRDRLSVEPFRYGTHCYWISAEFAAAARELFNPVFAPIDAMLRATTHYASWQCEVHWPSLAGQDDSPSDIRPVVSPMGSRPGVAS